MSGDLPSPLASYQGAASERRSVSRVKPTSGEEKVYHPTRPPGGLRFLSETASLQEAGRALAIGPHPSSYLNSHPFLVRSSNYASGD